MKSNWAGILAQFEFYLPQILCEKHKLQLENDLQKQSFLDLCVTTDRLFHICVFLLTPSNEKTYDMNALFQLIKSMNTYECRPFKLIANRTNQSPDRKDIILFEYYRKYNNKCDEKKIAKKFYGDNINAFYMLKNRLLSKANVEQAEDQDIINYNR